jgi:hypothetical protein
MVSEVRRTGESAVVKSGSSMEQLAERVSKASAVIQEYLATEGDKNVRYLLKLEMDLLRRRMTAVPFGEGPGPRLVADVMLLPLNRADLVNKYLPAEIHKMDLFLKWAFPMTKEERNVREFINEMLTLAARTAPNDSTVAEITAEIGVGLLSRL